MLSFNRKSKSINKSLDFLNITKSGKKLKLNGLIFFYKPNSLPYAKFAVSVAKRNLRFSFVRSRVKRLHREAFRSLQNRMFGYDVIVFVQQDMSYEQVLYAWNFLCKSLENH